MRVPPIHARFACVTGASGRHGPAPGALLRVGPATPPVSGRPAGLVDLTPELVQALLDRIVRRARRWAR